MQGTRVFVAAGYARHAVIAILSASAGPAFYRVAVLSGSPVNSGPPVSIDSIDTLGFSIDTVGPSVDTVGPSVDTVGSSVDTVGSFVVIFPR